jgi:hypothetical protein
MWTHSYIPTLQEKHTVSILRAEYEDSMFIQNVGMYLRVHKASQQNSIVKLYFNLYLVPWKKTEVILSVPSTSNLESSMWLNFKCVNLEHNNMILNFMCGNVKIFAAEKYPYKINGMLVKMYAARQNSTYNKWRKLTSFRHGGPSDKTMKESEQNE